MTPDRADAVIERLATRGFAVEPGFFPDDLCSDLRHQAARLPDDPDAIEAGVGRGERHVRDLGIRRARIRWMEGETPAEKRFLATAEALRSAINRRLFLGLYSFEAQLALTPVGGFYARHLDSFEGARNRVVSLVAYLDAGWRDRDGGALRVWRPEPRAADATDFIDILPECGTLVLMLSESVSHEVLPCNRARASIAGWFRIRQ